MKTLRSLTGALVVALFAIGCAGDADTSADSGDNTNAGNELNREISIANAGERVTLSVPAMT